MRECIYCDLEENHGGFHTCFMNRSPTSKDIHRTVPRVSAQWAGDKL
jgi:hypothetical protein